LLAIYLILPLPLCAQDQTIAQMVHTAWTGRDGVPAGIRALAQTPDGILWIASLKGLYTFDGLTFAPFHPDAGSAEIPPVTLRTLIVANSGDLWVAGYHGPAARIHKGHVTISALEKPRPNDALDYLQQDATGDMWAVANDRQLVRLGPDEVWHPMPNPVPQPGHVSCLFIDAFGTQWVIENDALYRRPKGEERFLPTGISAHFPPMIREGVGHTLWILAPVSEARSGHVRVKEIQQVDQSGRLLAGPTDFGDPSDLLPASDGSLWLLKANDEIERFSSSDISAWRLGHTNQAADVMKLGDGAGGPDFHAFMIDGEGGVWSGGFERLERFATAKLVPAIPGAKAGRWSSCVDSSGDIFISHPPAELYRIREGKLARLTGVKDASQIFCAPDGTVYMESNGVVVVREGKESHLPLLPGFGGYGDNYIFTGFLPLPDGRLIGAVGGPSTGATLWLYQDSKWSRFLPNESFSEVTGMFVDSHRVIYLGHADGTISVVNGTTFASLPMGAIPVSAINGFSETSYGVFAHAARGIGLIRHRGFQFIQFAEEDYSKGVTGLTQAPNGDIWINGREGIVHIPSDEILAAIAEPNHKVSATNVQEQDFKGPTEMLLFSDTAQVDHQGEIWFSTLNGVVSVDPLHLGLTHPPQITIRGITGDGSAPDARSEFPPNIATLSIQYLGVNLADPRRVTYRYKLEGLDPDWLDVGHRTEAIYTHPHPGHYTFHVMASNGDGVWNGPVASASFTVLPRYYQTKWFVLVSLASAMLMLWVAYVCRFRFASRAIRQRAEERADERIRIARELHDTLLQGVQGLLLTFHVASQKVPPEHESKQALERALATAEQIIVEGRDRVSRLRSEQLTDSELKPSIERFAAELNGTASVDVTVERLGGNDALDVAVVEEIFCIAREALTNAFRHAEASRILVELDYQTRQFRFTCRDNGRGFDVGVVQARQTNGHWGLRGMAERAARIGGKFSNVSSPGKGTEIKLSVPARRAYAHTNRTRITFAKLFRNWP
jgi:signal transduction histidine kinase/ligand-binding sensor domain-containing protein